jgi:hypothetical protein
MDVHWDAVIQGTVTGLVGAAVIAGLVSSRNRIRNLLQRVRIQRALDSTGFGYGISGITTGIHNETGREMVVRQVAFRIGGNFIVLLPSGELTSAYKGQRRKPTRAEMRRLRRGEMIQGQAEMHFATWRVPPGLGGFVALPPYTKTSFTLPAQFIADSDQSVESIRVVLEYVTRGGDKKLLQHDIKPKHPAHLQKTLDHFRAELKNGNLNEARRNFGMAEVVVRQKAEKQTGRDCE